ncbi:hypothetical protein [Amycolatopsis nalaikhensis]|uniref:Uncharacterized protein n=1 Tax=Amycolatopsis nalaikhensis TaxID=715472 RepID=A0ABY8XET1_9PSEU|nr:hypothetical protein [Amycolatopsis sp. 2-2]WIV54134.1 hypothetical protein QP939_35440 [Amycolatopsis sp. 2-2]
MRGGTPAVRNVAANVVFPPTPLVRDQDIVLLPLPANGTSSAGPFRPDPARAPSPEVYLVENPVT